MYFKEDLDRSVALSMGLDRKNPLNVKTARQQALAVIGALVFVALTFAILGKKDILRLVELVPLRQNSEDTGSSNAGNSNSADFETNTKWWHEVRGDCLKKKEWPKQMCRKPDDEVVVWHIKDEQLATLTALVAQHEGLIPSDAVDDALKANVIPHEYVAKDCAKSAQWTIDNPPAADGLHHVLVSDVPCAKHGCCALAWTLRANSTDLRSFRNHFVSNEYEAFLDFPIYPKFILDAGGVGMSAVFLAMIYPDASIVRVEPHAGNFMAGASNAVYFPRIKQVNLGLWDDTTTLQMCENMDIDWGENWPFSGSRQQAYFVREETDPPCRKVALDDIKVTTIAKIMELYGIPRFDAIKMDIEGSEHRVFADSAMDSAMKKTSVFITESHERFFQGSMRNVVQTFKRVGQFHMFNDGDDHNVFFVKKNWFTCDV